MHYSEELANKMEVSEDNRLQLDITYKELFNALDFPEAHPNVEEVVRSLEFRLQSLWGFPQEGKFHRYQMEIKGCTCPVLDNWELRGHTEARYVTSDCPWHWKEPNGTRD